MEMDEEKNKEVKLKLLGIVKTGSPHNPMTNYEGEIISRFKQVPTALFADKKDRVIAYQSNHYLGNYLKTMIEEKDFFPSIFKSTDSILNKTSLEIKKFMFEFKEESGYITTAVLEEDKEKKEINVIPEEAIALSHKKDIPIYTDQETMEKISYELPESQLLRPKS